MEEYKLLMKLDNLIECRVLKRPSKFCKTPYVADIITNNNEELLAHTASLGCCGLVDCGATILVSKTMNKKSKCSHIVYLSVIKDQIIGVHPKLAENMVEVALQKNLLTRLQNVQKYQRETAIYVKDLIDSRFDFTGIDSNGVRFIMEVKNVPLADYEDVSSKERKKWILLEEILIQKWHIFRMVTEKNKQIL